MMICKICVEACRELKYLQDCAGYDDGRDITQHCECSHCENWDDPNCWTEDLDIHDIVAHSIKNCEHEQIPQKGLQIAFNGI